MEAVTDFSAKVLKRGDFDLFLAKLRDHGYTTVGPTVHEGAIVLEEVVTASDFPVGKTALQERAKYRLQDRDDQALFGYVVGASSAKRWLFPPRRTLWRAKTDAGAIEFCPAPAVPSKTALIGLRACDLHAIEIQDRVFLKGDYVDSYYKEMRARLLLVVVDCAEPASTCFCTSVGGSPAAEAGFDIRLTEIIDPEGHRFLFEPGSTVGQQIAAELPLSEVTPNELSVRASIKQKAEQTITRRLETDGLKELLYRNANNPRWEGVAQRCLACGSCTMVCPTCFCSNIEEVSALGSNEVHRDRVWDSCFNEDFSYIHGGSIRLSTMSRYRQWMTHKLAAWTDQFGVMGCVGCGRCITWCPVGIDITEEAAGVRRYDIEAHETAVGGS